VPGASTSSRTGHLSGISQLFGVDVESLRRANRLKAADVKSGDRIRIPDRPPEEKVHREVVRHHESNPTPPPDLCREEKVYHACPGGHLVRHLPPYAVDLEDLLRLNG